jgi:hypothetical protein
VPAPGGPNPPWSARRPFTVVWSATGLPGLPGRAVTAGRWRRACR